jgi:hypothetical protein
MLREFQQAGRGTVIPVPVYYCQLNSCCCARLASNMNTSATASVIPLLSRERNLNEILGSIGGSAGFEIAGGPNFIPECYFLN